MIELSRYVLAELQKDKELILHRGQSKDDASRVLAIGLSTTIGHVHRCGIIHKDIKPANVLLNPVTGRCWLMGFGIASRLPRERQAPEPPEFTAGTLAYIVDYLGGQSTI